MEVRKDKEQEMLDSKHEGLDREEMRKDRYQEWLVKLVKLVKNN